jgi:hypothetical protein
MGCAADVKTPRLERRLREMMRGNAARHAAASFILQPARLTE